VATRQEILNTYLGYFDAERAAFGVRWQSALDYWTAGNDHMAIMEIINCLNGSSTMHLLTRNVIEALMLMTDEEHLLAWLRAANADAPW